MGFVGFGQKPAPGLPSPYRKHLRNKGPAPPSAGLPSPSSLRDATSPKVRGFGYTGKFAFSKKLSLWESWREAPERARTLARSCALGLALPYGSAAPSEARSKPRPCAAVSGLTLSVIASRCHLSQSERPWQSAKFPGLYFTPCCRKGSRRRCAQTFRLCQGLPLWERLPPAGGRCRICDRGRTAGAKRLRGRARQRKPCAFV